MTLATTNSATTQLSATTAELDYIFSTRAIRERCEKIYTRALRGEGNFKVDLTKIDGVARLTVEQCKKNYPDLNIPFHSRWKHFDVGGLPRNAALNAVLEKLSPRERAFSKIDLVIVSVLLDAGAGMAWSYKEAGSGLSLSKSEGLAVASLHMFLSGVFSSNLKNPFQVDATGLDALSFEKFKAAFQVSDSNPLVGDRGRFELLKALGQVLRSKKEFFGGTARPGNLLAYLENVAKKRGSNSLLATDILTALQRGMGEIWPGRVSINNINIGDVWPHPALGTGFESLIPFHKLSQWLTYSMVDPINESGLSVLGFDDLSCLAEYRNGGLLYDGEVISLRDQAALEKSHAPSSELVIEWRALTVVLMEKVADRVRELLGKTKNELPLGKVLEGGTWWAGRVIAAAKRADGGSPIKIASDGTVF